MWYKDVWISSEAVWVDQQRNQIVSENLVRHGAIYFSKNPCVAFTFSMKSSRRLPGVDGFGAKSTVGGGSGTRPAPAARPTSSFSAGRVLVVHCSSVLVDSCTVRDSLVVVVVIDVIVTFVSDRFKSDFSSQFPCFYLFSWFMQLPYIFLGLPILVRSFYLWFNWFHPAI